MCCVLYHYRNVHGARGQKQSYIFKRVYLYIYIYFGLNLIKSIFLGSLLAVNSHFRNVRLGKKNCADNNHMRLFRKAIMSLGEIFFNSSSYSHQSKSEKPQSYHSVMNILF